MIKKYSLVVVAFLCFVFSGFGQYSGTGTFTKITSLSQLTDGHYVIAEVTNEDFAMNNSHNGTLLGQTAISPASSVITNPATSIAWKIETNGSGKSVYNESISKYISYTGSSNNVQIVDNVTSDNQRWNITYSSGEFIFTNIAVTNRILQYNSASPRFVCYATSQTKFALYKLAASTGPTITYNGNGSTGGIVPTDAGPYTSGDTVTVLDNTGSLTKTCSTFDGWNTLADGTGTDYAVGSTFTITGNTTLYAQWTSTGKTVTFDNNTGAGTMTPQVACISTNLTANAFTKASYTFSGWNTAADNSGIAYAGGASYAFTADVTLYAHWVPYVGPCLSQLNFTTTPTGWAQNNITYLANEANFAFTSGDLSTLAISNPNLLTFDLRRSSNSSAKALLVEVSTTTQGGVYTTIATYDHSNTTSAATTSCSVNLSAYSSFSNVYIRFRKVSSTISPWYLKNVEVFCGAPIPAPEMNLKQGGTSYATTKVSLGSDTYDFGNQLVASNTDIQFTIENTGDDDLTLSAPVIAGTGFGLQTGLSLTTVTGPSGTSTFTVRFTPNALGAFAGTISIANNDGDENPYVINIKGNGTNSNASDIITSPGFTYTNNIPYITNQATGPFTNATGNVGVFRFDVRDGGGTDDSDALGTELNSITFNVGTTHINYIRAAGLFSGTAVKANNPTIDTGAGTITFSGLSGTDFTATDPNGTLTLTLRVSFKTNVTDNEKLVFTISNATANTSGSVFAASNAGGAFSDNNAANDKNRIEVTADRLKFTTQPTDTSISTNMSPAPIVSLADVNSNIDLDITTGTITMSSTGTPNAQPSATISNGKAVFSTVNHSVAGGPFTLTASYAAWSIVSGSFNINNAANGSYRTIDSGDWLNNKATPAIWERLSGSTWAASNSPSYNTTNDVYIRNGHTISSGGSWGSSINLMVNDGGIFNANHSGTMGSIHVYDGGALHVNASMSNNGTFEVEDNGTVVINNQYGNGNETIPSLWNGTEIFHPSSILIFNDFDCADDYLIPNNTSITPNTFNGYEAVFGNIIVDFGTNLSPSDDWKMLDNGVTINMAHGDLTFRSTSSGADMRIATTGTITSGIGGDFIVEDGYDNTQKINFKTSGTLNFTIKGNMELNAATTSIAPGANANSTVSIEGNLTITPSAALNFNSTVAAGESATINLYGDLSVAGSGLLYNNNSSKLGIFNFAGTGDGLTDATTQTIDIASTSSNENKYINFNINNSAYVKLKNQHFELGENSSLIVNNGGTLDFGFDAIGTSALNVGISFGQGGSVFNSKQGSTLKITSPDGINTSGYTGNVRTLPSGRTFNQTATFYYIGKANQVTGNALTVGSTVKNVYAILDNDNLELRLTNRTGIDDGGKLEIQRGIVIGEEAGTLDTDDLDFYGPDGRLVMTGGEYRISTITNTPLTAYLPKLRKYGSYSLTGGTVHLNGNNAVQILSGAANYVNLKFSAANTLGTNYKGISSATSVSNSIVITDTAIVDVKEKVLGGSNTKFTMLLDSRYITDGAGEKPDASGAYSLSPRTIIEYANNSGAGVVRIGSPIINYANIVVTGSNVSNDSPTTGIHFQSGGTFTAKNGGTFKLLSPAGFTGSNATAIDIANTPTITLEDGSTIEYKGGNQILTDFTTNADASNNYYANVNISGTGIKAMGTNAGITIGGDLNVKSSTLLIDNSKYIEVEHNVTNNGLIEVKTKGSFVQKNDGTLAGTFANTTTGVAEVLKQTGTFQTRGYNYTYWSSPVNGGQDIVTVFPNARGDRRFYFEASNFVDHFKETSNQNQTTVEGQDDIDDNNNDWQSASGVLTVGRGYAVTAGNPPGTGAYTDSALFSGSFNTGDITVPIYKNDTEIEDNNWNFIGNPYPSAISVNKFFDANSDISDVPLDPPIDGEVEGAIFLWSQASPADLDNNGNQVYNFSQADYAIINRIAETAGGNGIRPLRYIPSGQGFFIAYKENLTVEQPGYTTGSVVFKNSMREKLNNNQFFRTSTSSDNNDTAQRDATSNDSQILWLNQTTNNGVFNQIAIAYADQATDGYDGWSYDTPYNLSATAASSVYSIIAEKPENKFAIQGKHSNSLNLDEVIPLGFYTTITEPTTYNLSIDELKGEFLTSNTIYLRDNLQNFVHNLSASDYVFSSEVGEFNTRFEIVFKDQALSVIDNEIPASGLSIVELPNGEVKFTVGNNLDIKAVEIIDMLGRTLYHLKGDSPSEIYELSNLSVAAYLAKVTLSNGQVITKRAVKRK